MIPAIVKDSIYEQAITFNLSFFSLTTGQRKKLRRLEAAYQKSIEPGAHKNEFEYIIKGINETNYISIKNHKMIILTGSNHITDKEFIKIANRIRKSISDYEDT